MSFMLLWAPWLIRLIILKLVLLSCILITKPSSISMVSINWTQDMQKGWSSSNRSTLLKNTSVGKRMWSRMPYPEGILCFLFWKQMYLDSIQSRLAKSRILILSSSGEGLKDGPYIMQEGYLFRYNMLCIPICWPRELLFQVAHSGTLACHFGQNKTIDILRAFLSA